jgi:putative two-component system response regulator
MTQYVQESASEGILVLDRDADSRRRVGELLAQAGYSCSFAAGLVEGQARLAETPHALAICSLGSGAGRDVETILELQRLAPQLAVIVCVDASQPISAEVALEHGAVGYMSKPIDRDPLLVNVASALSRREAERAAERSEAEARERVASLRSALGEMRHSQRETIHRLSRAIELRDADTGLHARRIGEHAWRLGGWLGLDRDTRENLLLAAPLHDVGNMGISDQILLKSGRLTPGEREQMQRHTVIGHDLLSNSGVDLLDTAASIALTHHERYDGSGYPNGLRADEIPLEGRIVGAVDVLDALLSERSYRRAIPIDEATEHMRQGSGTLFDPDVVAALLEHLHDVVDTVGLSVNHAALKARWHPVQPPYQTTEAQARSEA